MQCSVHIVPGDSKNVPLDKMQFLTTYRYFLPKFQDLQQKVFSTILENFPKYFDCFKNHSFYNFILYSKITPLAMFNVAKHLGIDGI